MGTTLKTSRKWYKPKRVAVLLLLAGLTGISVPWIVAGKLVAPVQRAIGELPADLMGEQIALDSDSGAKIAGWYLPEPGGTCTVILLHALHGSRRSMLDRARFLGDAGYSTLLIDMQAHGGSQAEAITFGHLESLDVEAAVAYARSRAPENKIAALGWSLGGAAILLANGLDLDAAILESVYPTIGQAMHNRVAMRLGPLAHVVVPALALQLPLRLGISLDDLRPIDHIADIGCPILVLGGGADEHTPAHETEALFGAAIAPKQLHLFEGAAHVNLHGVAPAVYESKVLGFLSRHLASQSSE